MDGFQHQQGVAEDPTGIVFEIDLDAGRHELRGAFADAAQRALCSAFYAEVEYLEAAATAG